MEFSFHIYNTMARTGAAMAFRRLLGDPQKPPVLLCIGSDLAIGDSLGPLVGTSLRRRDLFGYVYGTLRAPVTAKEIGCLKRFLAEAHPGSKVIAIDAAVGEDSELGLIKISDAPLKPGAGANKRLGKIGDISVLGIVTKKSAFPYSSLNLTRLNTVCTMAEVIADALSAFLARKNEFSERKLQKGV